MNLLASLPFAAITEFSVGHLYGLIGLIGGLLVAIIVPTAAMYFHHRRQQLWHETARIALEKGQPVPPRPRSDEEMELTPPAGVAYDEWLAAKRAQQWRHDIKGGLVLIAVGVGLYLMLGSSYLGAVPGMIGVALLVYAYFNRPAGPRP